MGNWLERLKNKVANFFKTLWDKVTDWWEDGVEWVSNNVPPLIDLAEGLKTFLEGRVDNILLSDVLGIRGYKAAEQVMIAGLTRSIKYLGHVKDVEECLQKDKPSDQIDCLGEKLKQITKKGDEGSQAFNFAKEALMDVLEKKGQKPDEKKVERIIQGFYEAKTLNKG